MNMTVRHPGYIRGERVGTVDLAELFGPLQVPVVPDRWVILRVAPNREAKVMKEFNRRNISAWLPTMTSPQEKTRNVVRFGRRIDRVERRNVVSPMILGGVLMPEFEFNLERWKAVDGTFGLLRFGEWAPRLRPCDIEALRRIEAIANTPKSKHARLFEIGQLVRVVNGPFKSLCARVERLDSPGRLSVGVDLFGRITPAELGESDIETV